MKYWIGTRVRLSKGAKRHLLESAQETEHLRVAQQDRIGIVVQWVRKAMRPTGYLVDFGGVYMALGEEDLVAVE